MENALSIIKNKLVPFFKQSSEVGSLDTNFDFIGQEYLGNAGIKMELGDEVWINPVLGRSGATTSYKAKVGVTFFGPKEYKNKGRYRNQSVCLIGIEENISWHGALLNEYAFCRLEFIRRGEPVYLYKKHSC